MRWLLLLPAALSLLFAACDDMAADANGGAAQTPVRATAGGEGGGVPPGDGGDWAAVVLMDYRFVPNRLEVRAGEALEIDVQNRGAEQHTFTLDAISGEVQIVGVANDGPQSGIVDVVLEPEASAIVRLRPNTPGEYVFYCAIPGHREVGLEGLLVVGEPRTR